LSSLRPFTNEIPRGDDVFECCAMLTSLVGNIWLMISLV
jgi:hypothetical protein